MPQKRAIIVHCWSGTPNYCWYPQAKKDLERLGFKVSVPAMPETDAPRLDLWLPVLRELIGQPDRDLVLIGHSIGTVAIMRYLETLAEGQAVGRVILVAGFTDSLNFPELANFFPGPLDFDRIKTRTEKFTIINSDNDPYVPLKHGHELKDQLGGDLIIKHLGHFSGPLDDEASCLALPDIAAALSG